LPGHTFLKSGKILPCENPTPQRHSIRSYGTRQYACGCRHDGPATARERPCRSETLGPRWWSLRPCWLARRSSREARRGTALSALRRMAYARTKTRRQPCPLRTVHVICDLSRAALLRREHRPTVPVSDASALSLIGWRSQSLTTPHRRDVRTDQDGARADRGDAP
jgi:hypothetical protein